MCPENSVGSGRSYLAPQLAAGVGRSVDVSVQPPPPQGVELFGSQGESIIGCLEGSAPQAGIDGCVQADGNAAVLPRQGQMQVGAAGNISVEISFQAGESYTLSLHDALPI